MLNRVSVQLYGNLSSDSRSDAQSNHSQQRTAFHGGCSLTAATIVNSKVIS